MTEATMTAKGQITPSGGADFSRQTARSADFANEMGAEQVAVLGACALLMRVPT